MDEDLRSVQETRDLLTAASSAQRRLAKLTQEAIDRIVGAVAAAAAREAAALAALAHDETGFGNTADKTIKNLFAARTIYESIRTLKTVGVLREDRARGLVEIACPKGVVAAIIPSTNPTSTAIYKILIALKAGCGIVLSPHPAALRCVQRTYEVCRDAAESAGAPVGIVGCLSAPNPQSTRELMHHRATGVILATGGLGLVRAAYSAGKPAYGVGPGNVPAFIERTADVAKAVRDIVASTTFDFGTICSSEQAIVVDRSIEEHVRAALLENGAYFLSKVERERLGPVVITADRRVNPAVVGRPAPVIARLAGIDVPPTTRVLIAELDRVGNDEPLSLEKLSPVLAYYVEDGWERGCERCIEILRHGGLGHTMAIHSADDRIIRQFGLEKPVFRIVVNSPSTHGAIGLTTGVAPSMTLGCGALGGNITSDNITPLHLIDIKRLAYEVRPLVAGDRPAADASPLSVVTRSPALAPTASTSARHQVVEKVVGEFLAARSAAPRVATGGVGPASSAPRIVPTAVNTPKSEPPAAAPSARLIDIGETGKPEEFVCEDDVRRALSDGRELAVDAKTIITPAARDAAAGRGVLRRRG